MAQLVEHECAVLEIQVLNPGPGKNFSSLKLANYRITLGSDITYTENIRVNLYKILIYH